MSITYPIGQIHKFYNNTNEQRVFLNQTRKINIPLHIKQSVTFGLPGEINIRVVRARASSLSCGLLQSSSGFYRTTLHFKGGPHKVGLPN